MTRFGAAPLAASLSLVWPALGIGQVTVTGSGSVGVGQMTNSTINLGLTPKEAQALAKATAQEQTKILKAIVDRVINQSYNDKSKEQAELLALVQGFLSIVKGKQVPTDDWPQTFQELMRQFLTLGERLQAMPVTSDKIKQLVSEADAARRALQLEQADQLLAKAGNLAIEDAKTKQAQAKASTRQSASIMVSRATLAFTRLERIQGALLLEEAFDMRQLDPSSQTIWWLFEAGDAWLAQGRNDEALKRYVKARAAALAQTILDPKNAHWKRDLSISHDRIGYVQQARGEPDQALKSYLTSLEILRKLAAADSGSANRQRDLSIAHMRIGSLLENQGDLRKALKSYQAATAIRQKLVDVDPASTRRQQDLSSSQKKIAEAQLAQGDVELALQSHQAAMAIRQKLAASDPTNAQLKHGISLSHQGIGDLHLYAFNPVQALESYKAAMVIAQNLVNSDLRNTTWQQSVLVCHQKIGRAHGGQRNPGEALTGFQAALAIAENLAASNPANTRFQSLVSISHGHIGRMQQVQGNSDEALESYRAQLAIAENLAALDPRDVKRQLDVVDSCWKVYEATPAQAGDRRKHVLF